MAEYIETSKLQGGILMNMIEVQNLTKDYGNNRGIFHLNFSIKQGETVAFLGTNGAGKTTTIRQLMGFVKPQNGIAKINGLDCFQQEEVIQKQVGYLSGEIAFLDENMTGQDFIKFMSDIKKIENHQRIKQLITYFELDIQIKIKKMSKGTKQKIGLIVAFMQDAPVLILDEPTSGLDPIMQNKFIELIMKEKSNGKTIIMSSHIFEEVEHTCDRILCIKDGKLIADENVEDIKCNRSKQYSITFSKEQDALNFAKKYSDVSLINSRTALLMLTGSINDLLHELYNYDVTDIDVRNQTLEELFLQYYGGNKQ